LRTMVFMLRRSMYIDFAHETLDPGSTMA